MNENNTNSEQTEMIFEKLGLMTSEEAAIYLKKTVGAIRTAVCRNHIAYYKLGRRLYFKKQDLDVLFLNSLKKGG